MKKVIVDDESIKCVVRYKYNQNNKVIDLSDLDTSKCTSINDLFYGMSKLEEIKGFNLLNLSNVTNMSFMCSNCYSLKKLDLSGVDLHNVEDMAAMCSCCHSLEELNLSGLNLAKVTRMSGMCDCCYSLKELNLLGAELHDIVDTSCMCGDCCSLIDFKVDEQYKPKFQDTINEVDRRKSSIISKINFSSLKIPSMTKDKSKISLMIDDYEQQNKYDLEELELLIDQIGILKQLLKKRTELINRLKTYEESINDE